MEKYKGREQDLFLILYHKCSCFFLFTARYGKQPWSLAKPAPSSPLDDFSSRLKALRSNVWGIVLALTKGETIEPDNYNTCQMLQEQLKERDATIKELKAELEKTEEKPSFESDSDDASVAVSEATSEIFTTEQDVLEASPIPLSVSQQLDLAIKSLSSEAHTSPVESAVCTLAVADLQKWKAIIEQGTSHSR